MAKLRRTFDELADALDEFNYWATLTFGLTFSFAKFLLEPFWSSLAFEAIVACPEGLTALWRADEVFGELSLV